MNYDAIIRDLQERLSYLERSGAPDYTPWTDYSASSTASGWSGTPTVNVYYKKIGKLVFISYYVSGTSNQDYAYFLLPYALHASFVTNMTFPIASVDNGAANPGGVCYFTDIGSVSFYKDVGGSAWTNSGLKSVRGQFWYETA